MVGRHAQVGQDTIDPGYSVQPQGAPHEAEVAFDVMEAAVFRAVVPGIPILIEGVKTSPVASADRMRRECPPPPKVRST